MWALIRECPWQEILEKTVLFASAHNVTENTETLTRKDSV